VPQDSSSDLAVDYLQIAAEYHLPWHEDYVSEVERACSTKEKVNADE
jgi:hypothetical protein